MIRHASTPPQSERFKDQWENVRLSQPRPGDLFNRRTCAWYWSSKRKDVTLLQGLVAFAKEDYETAEKHWNLLSELDKGFYAQQQAAGWGDATTLARLTWNLKNQKGSLYATPEEMASFKDPKRRLAVLIADLFYESEQPDRALSIYRRLERKELGTLSKNEQAYVTLGVFVCLCWNPKFDETAYILPRTQLFVDTPSEPRAIFYYANRLRRYGGVEGYYRTVKAYETCIAKYPNSKEAKHSKLFLAETYKDLGNVWIRNNRFDQARKSYELAYQCYHAYRETQKNSEELAKQITQVMKEYEVRGFAGKR
jgi:tetratricopeptide (TPR) repeat protein